MGTSGRCSSTVMVVERNTNRMPDFVNQISDSQDSELISEDAGPCSGGQAVVCFVRLADVWWKIFRTCRSRLQDIGLISCLYIQQAKGTSLILSLVMPISWKRNGWLYSLVCGCFPTHCHIHTNGKQDDYDVTAPLSEDKEKDGYVFYRCKIRYRYRGNKRSYKSLLVRPVLRIR